MRPTTLSIPAFVSSAAYTTTYSTTKTLTHYVKSATPPQHLLQRSSLNILKVIYHPLYSMSKFVTNKSKLPQDGAQVFPYIG